MHIGFEYDALNRVLRRYASDPAGTVGEVLADYEYDNASVVLGRLARSRSFNADGTVEVANIAFDDDGQLLEQELTVPGPFGGRFRQTYTYGLGGQLVATTYPKDNAAASGEVLTTVYDPRTGLPVGLSSDTRGTIVDGTEYGPDGLRRSRTFGEAGADALEVWTVDPRTERIDRYTAGVAGAIDNVVSMSYTYDTRDNPTSVVDNVNAGQTSCYTFDNFSRLTAGFTAGEACAAHNAAIGEQPFDESYDYDNIHNLVFKTGVGSLTYGANDSGPYAVTSTSFGAQYRYDGNGNQILRDAGDQAHILVFDTDNRLAKVALTTQAASPANLDRAGRTRRDWSRPRLPDSIPYQQFTLSAKALLASIEAQVHAANDKPVDNVEVDLFGLWLALKGRKPKGKPRSNKTKARSPCRSNSFVPDTRVLMADGASKPIQSVEIGDYVWAANPGTGEVGPRRVIDTIVGEGEKHLVDVHIGDSVITATDGHPFWVDDQGRWVNADGLEAGDQLLLADGSIVAVDRTATRVALQRVHNLTVDGVHTYYVVANVSAVLVHNCRVDELGGSAGNFDADELAQLAYQHAGAGDIAGRPTLDQISRALATDGVRLPDQNAVKFLLDDVVVIINEDLPTRSTAFFQGS